MMFDWLPGTFSTANSLHYGKLNFNLKTAFSIWSNFKRNNFVSCSKNFCLWFPFILFKPSSFIGLYPIGTARETQMCLP